MTDIKMEKSETEMDQRNRLEKDKKQRSIIVPLDDDITEEEQAKIVPAMTTSSETKPYQTKTCYLLTKSNSSVAIQIPAEDIILSDLSSTSCAQMSIINVSSSKDNPVFICCFKSKTKESSPDKNPTSESQTSANIGINAKRDFGSQVEVIDSATSCSQQTKTNQADIVDPTSQNLPTSTSATADHPIATIGTTDSTTISHFCHKLKEEQIDITCDQYRNSLGAPSGKKYVGRYTIQTATNQPHTSPATGNLSATTPSNGTLEAQCLPSTVNYQLKTSQADKQPSGIQTSLDTTQQSTSDGASESSLLEDKIEPSSTIRLSNFKPVSKHDTLQNSCFKPITINDDHQAGHRAGSPSSPKKPPSYDHLSHATIDDSQNQAESGSSNNTRNPPNCDHSTHAIISDHHNQAEDRSSPSNPKKPPSCEHATDVTINDVPNQAKDGSLNTTRKPPICDHSNHVTAHYHQVEDRSQPSTPKKLPYFDHSTHGTINDRQQAESPLSTPRKLPCFDHPTTCTKQGPADDCILPGSWDPLCHHIEYHERNMTLPCDLRYLKESELIPMTYGDFRKCLEDEDLCCTPPEMMRSADDDGVVPSSSPLLPSNEARCYSTSSDTSTDTSLDCTWEGYSARDENIYKSPSMSYTGYPQYGTLNWGLTPTIIYKTPEPDASIKDSVGNDYMKCSISAGNVELLTPPPPNYKNLLRRSRRRMERRHVKRRRIYFGTEDNCQGLQEVPVNESAKNTGQSIDTDFVPDDPMWFEDELDGTDLINDDDKQFSAEQSAADCYENLGNTSPNSEKTTDTYQILADVAEYIKNVEETPGTVTAFNADYGENNDAIQAGESAYKDTLEIVPAQFSWDEMDDSSLEIQEILDGLSVPREEEASMEGGELEPSDSFSQEEENEAPKKTKRKRITSTKQNARKKRKKSPESAIDTPQYDNTQLNEVVQCCLGDENPRNDVECLSLSASQILDDNTGSRNNSQTSRCATPISPRPIPGVLVSPSVGFIPLQSIGKPMILPKPPQGDCFSPPVLQSPLISPQFVSTIRLIPSACSVPLPDAVTVTQFCPDVGNRIRTSPVTRPARKCRTRARKKDEDKRGGDKGSQKKCIPNGYMLYCKKRRNHVLKENLKLKSKPGDVTRILSENWKQLSDEEKRPYVEEAMKLRCDENEWINQSP